MCSTVLYPSCIITSLEFNKCFQSIDCDKSCKHLCTGKGPMACVECSNGYKNMSGYCLGKKLTDMILMVHAFYVYIKLCCL